VDLAVSPLGFGAPSGVARAGFHATTTIKRSDFGMDRLLAIAGDEIENSINIEAVRN
jgi:polyisoprenoid-binding protein YceI